MDRTGLGTNYPAGKSHRSRVEQKSRVHDPMDVHFHSNTGGGAGHRRSRGLAHFHPAGQTPLAHGMPCAVFIAHRKKRKHLTQKKGRRTKTAEIALEWHVWAAGRPSRTRVRPSCLVLLADSRSPRVLACLCPSSPLSAVKTARAPEQRVPGYMQQLEVVESGGLGLTTAG